jgi:hypothetical protein
MIIGMIKAHPTEIGCQGKQTFRGFALSVWSLR